MLKQTLIAFAAFAMAGSAAAADITNPFYLPTKGQVGSITSIDYTRNQYKNKFSANETTHSTNLSEELRYGLTDDVAFVANVGNIFAKLKEAFFDDRDILGTKTDTEDKNINWEAGFAWNIFNQAFKLQAQLMYGQDPSVNRFNKGAGEYKYVTGTIKTGYQFKTMLPYVEVGEQFPIGQKKGNDERVGADKPVYTAKIGLYQGKCETWALDTGIRYTHDENTDIKGTAYTAEVEASYYLAQNTTIGVYGTYALKGKAKVDGDIHDKTIGARLRWYF